MASMKNLTLYSGWKLILPFPNARGDQKEEGS